MPPAHAANTSRFTFTVAETRFLVVQFNARERISEMFVLNLELATEENIDLVAMISKPALLTIDGREEDRHINGMVHEFNAMGTSGRFNCYQAVVRPCAALLAHRKDCRIFQRLNVPAMVTQVLNLAGVAGDLFTFRLTGRYAEREYCVQYRETDLHFIRRLLAEEGIFFFFEHSREYHRMVFADSTANYPPIAGDTKIAFNPGGGAVADAGAVLRFRRGARLSSGKYVQRDYNFKKPSLDLSTHDTKAPYDHLELYDYPGAYDLPEQGARLARTRLEATLAGQDQARGESVVARFLPGFTFSLSDAPTDRHNASYLLTALTHSGEQPQVLAERSDGTKGTVYINRFTAIPAEMQFRPDFDPLRKPHVAGPQTAIVTGPAGEEIYTDRYGRIKVQFHWDRIGGNDEHTSCWIRVSQSSADAGWGAMYLPRIGQEVIVDFVDGDPDRPLVTGRVYHGENPPPYDLPEHKTVSTIKSSTCPGGEGFNEIRLEDRKGEEQIFIHGQKDMSLRIENDRRTIVGRDTHEIISNDLHEQIDGTRHQTIIADDAAKVDGTQTVTIAHDSHGRVSGNYGLETVRQIRVKAGTHMVIEAGDRITLKAGNGFITIDDSGVSIVGDAINFAASAASRALSTLPPMAPIAAPAMQSLVQTNWIDLDYRYADGSGVPGAKYEVTDENGTMLAKGLLDAKGRARAPLPLAASHVQVRYFSDPMETAVLKQNHPMPVQAPAGWFERMSTALKETWETTKDGTGWTWGMLKGDFNEDPSVGQIITNAAITAIPVVDQAGDARDIAATVKLIAWDKRYREIGVWFILVVTLVGLVPTFGSLLKGVLKLIWKAASLDKVLAVFNHFMKGNGIGYLKRLQAGDLKKHLNDTAAHAHKIFAAAIEKTKALKHLIPDNLKALHKKANETIASLEHAKSLINRKFAEVGEVLQRNLGRILARKTDDFQDGTVRTVVKKQQKSQPAENLDNLPDKEYDSRNTNSGSKTTQRDPNKSKKTEETPSAGPSRTKPSGKKGGKPRGERAPETGSQKRKHKRENESADTLADAGYDVNQGPHKKPNGKKPDYKIEDEYFDCLAPDTDSVDQVRKGISRKVKSGQTERIILNMDDTSLKPSDITEILQRKPKSGLMEVIGIRKGKITQIFP